MSSLHPTSPNEAAVLPLGGPQVAFLVLLMNCICAAYSHGLALVMNVILFLAFGIYLRCTCILMFYNYDVRKDAYIPHEKEWIKVPEYVWVSFELGLFRNVLALKPCCPAEAWHWQKHESA